MDQGLQYAKDVEQLIGLYLANFRLYTWIFQFHLALIIKYFNVNHVLLSISLHVKCIREFILYSLKAMLFKKFLSSIFPDFLDDISKNQNLIFSKFSKILSTLE